jgi:hypothetical protein
LPRQDCDTEAVNKSAASEAEQQSHFRRMVYAATFGVLLYLVAGLATAAVLGALVALGMAPSPGIMQFLPLSSSISAGLYGAYSGWSRAPASQRRARRRVRP